MKARKPAKKPARKPPKVIDLAALPPDEIVYTSKPQPVDVRESTIREQARLIEGLQHELADAKELARRRSAETLDYRDTISNMTPELYKRAAEADIEAKYGAKFHELSRQVAALKAHPTGPDKWREVATRMHERARQAVHMAKYGRLRGQVPALLVEELEEMVTVFRAQPSEDIQWRRRKGD